MEPKVDPSFFTKLAAHLDDFTPDCIIKDASTLQALQDSLITTNPKYNLLCLSLLRAWCRKIKIHDKLQSDTRVIPNFVCCKKLKEQENLYDRFCLAFAEYVSALFCKFDLFPLACITCKELLEAGKVPPSEMIIDRCRDHLNDKICRVTLLEILANSSQIISGLPIYDPEIVYNHPVLYQHLVNISPDSVQDEIHKIKSIVSTIDAINSGKAKPNRDLIQFCDPDVVFKNISPEELAMHPDGRVRVRFYRDAFDNKVEICSFLEPLLIRGIFDDETKTWALRCLQSRIEEIKSIKMSPLMLASLQCYPIPTNHVLFQYFVEIINNADDFNKLCCWCRYIFSAYPETRALAQKEISKIIKQEFVLDDSILIIGDHMLREYIAALKIEGTAIEKTTTQGLIDALMNKDQSEIVHKHAAKQLSKIIINPHAKIVNYLSQLRKLPLLHFTELFHAMMIRDGSFRVDNFDSFVEIMKNVRSGNLGDTIPIIARIAFSPLTSLEADGSNLLRLLRFAEKAFNIQCCSGYYEPIMYSPVKEYDNSDVIYEWARYKVQSNKIIDENSTLSKLSSCSIADPRLACDIVLQLEEDPSLVSGLLKMGSPQGILFLLLNATTLSRTPSKTIAKMVEEMFHACPDISLKLMQAIVEFGGQCKLPDNITDYILDEQTQRSALSCAVTFLRFNKDISSVEIDRVTLLLDHNPPVNITKQIITLASTKGRSEIGTKLLEHQDSVVKSLAFHIAELTPDVEAIAIKTAFDDQLKVCLRSSAIEFLAEYYNNHPVAKEEFQILYYKANGETLYTYSLLLLLRHVEIRNRVKDITKFVAQFIRADSSEPYTFAALNALHHLSFNDKRLCELITDLLKEDKYFLKIVHLLTTFSTETLSRFTTETVLLVTQGIDKSFNMEIDLRTNLVCINKLLFVKTIEFPAECAGTIMKLYHAFVSTGNSEYLLHLVIQHMFHRSLKSRKVASKSGFVEISLEEIQMVEPENRFIILKTCSIFMHGYEKGQAKLMKIWGTDFLSEIFTPDKTTTVFFLCMTTGNNFTQSMFLNPSSQKREKNITINKQTTLYDKLAKYIENPTLKKVHPLLLQLLATLINNEQCRNYLFSNRKIIPHYVSTMEKYVSLQDTLLLENWLKIFVVITLYIDGQTRLHELVRIPELLVDFFRGNKQIRENKQFICFIRNIVKSKLWSAIKDKVYRICNENREKHLIPIFEGLVSTSQTL